MTIKNYDVAIIGAQISGLLTAALLVRRGFRVLLIDHDGIIHKYGEDQYILPVLPEIILTPHPQSLITTIHTELGIIQDLRIHLQKFDPPFQIILPKKRLNLPLEKNQIISALTTEWPDISQVIEKFFLKIEQIESEVSNYLNGTEAFFPDGFFQRRRVRNFSLGFENVSKHFLDSDILEGFPQNHPILELFIAPLFFFSNISPRDASLAQFARTLGSFFRGASHLSTKVGHLRDMLLKKFTESGGEVLYNTKIESMKFSRRKAESMHLTDSQYEYQCNFLIDNTYEQIVRKYMPEKHLETLHEKYGSIEQPKMRFYVKHYVVNSFVVPQAMKANLFLLNGRTTVERVPEKDPDFLDPPILFTLRDAVGKKGKIPDQVVFTAVLPLIEKGKDRGNEFLQSIENALDSRVSRIVPFIEEHIQKISSPMNVVLQENETNFNPWNIHRIYHAMVPSQKYPFVNMGVSGISYFSPYKNLFFIGPYNLPGLGAEGEYAISYEIANRLVEYSKGKQLFRSPFSRARSVVSRPQQV